MILFVLWFVGDRHAAGGDSVGNCREFSLSNSELRGAAFDKQNALQLVRVRLARVQLARVQLVKVR